VEARPLPPSQLLVGHKTQVWANRVSGQTEREDGCVGVGEGEDQGKGVNEAPWDRWVPPHRTAAPHRRLRLASPLLPADFSAETPPRRESLRPGQECLRSELTLA